MDDPKRRPPISTRHAFALALDLAVRRDAFQSIVVPVLLRAPWVLALATLPPLEEAERQPLVLLLATLALCGDFVTLLVIGAMLRIRARSVFKAPPGVRPLPVSECYARGLGRVPWLFLTEIARNFALTAAASLSMAPLAFLRLRPDQPAEDLSWNLLMLAVSVLLMLPVVLLGFRLGVATESVVLDERDLGGAFQRSFRMMRGRFERWLELIAASAALVLGLALFCAVLAAFVPPFAVTGGISLLWLLVIAVMPVIQYAWTFFYLRLVEIDEPIVEVGPTYAAAGPELPPARVGTHPSLELVPPPDTTDPERDPEGAA